MKHKNWIHKWIRLKMNTIISKTLQFKINYPWTNTLISTTRSKENLDPPLEMGRVQQPLGHRRSISSSYRQVNRRDTLQAVRHRDPTLANLHSQLDRPTKESTTHPSRRRDMGTLVSTLQRISRLGCMSHRVFNLHVNHRQLEQQGKEAVLIVRLEHLEAHLLILYWMRPMRRKGIIVGMPDRPHRVRSRKSYREAMGISQRENLIVWEDIRINLEKGWPCRM